MIKISKCSAGENARKEKRIFSYALPIPLNETHALRYLLLHDSHAEIKAAAPPEKRPLNFRRKNPSDNKLSQIYDHGLIYSYRELLQN